MKRLIVLLSLGLVSLALAGNVVVVRGRGYQVEAAGGAEYWTVPADGLLVRWEMETTNTYSTVLDTSGNSYHATNYPSIDTGFVWHENEYQNIYGRNESVLFADGVDAYSEPLAQPFFNLTAFSVCGWVKMEAPTSYDGLFFSGDADNVWIGIALSGAEGGSTDDIRGHVRNETTSMDYGYTTGNALTTGVWHHVAMTWTNTGVNLAARMKLYIDGTSRTITQGAADNPANTGTTKNGLRIGRNATLYPQAWFDNMYFYGNRVLTDPEVGAFFTNSCPTNCLVQR